ncbi:MAG: hypothetical protein ACJ789_18320 [Thermomicrobiales bacterium]
MSVAAIVHIQGEDAFLAELDELPNPIHTFVLMRNIRKKDGKPLPYVTEGASAFMYAWNKITFIELMGEVPQNGKAPVSTAQGTTILGFFREDGDDS